MKESAELKVNRAAYLEKIIKYRGLPIPASVHYTAGYKDGSAILWAVSQTCAEAERRLEETIHQRDELLAALEMNGGVYAWCDDMEVLRRIEAVIASVKGGE